MESSVGQQTSNQYSFDVNSWIETSEWTKLASEDYNQEYPWIPAPEEFEPIPYSVSIGHYPDENDHPRKMEIVRIGDIQEIWKEDHVTILFNGWEFRLDDNVMISNDLELTLSTYDGQDARELYERAYMGGYHIWELAEYAQTQTVMGDEITALINQYCGVRPNEFSVPDLRDMISVPEAKKGPQPRYGWRG